MQRYRHPQLSAKDTVEPLQLSVFDRLEFGVISAFFGVIAGVLIALVVFWLSYDVFRAARPYNTWMVWFSLGYFFLIGMFRGAEAADVIVVGLFASAAAFIGGMGFPGDGATSDGNPRWRRSTWWSVAYFVGIGIIAWLT